MKNAMTFDDIYLLKDSAVKLVLKKIDVMDLEYALMEATFISQTTLFQWSFQDFKIDRNLYGYRFLRLQ